jgi:hypothetical protein
VNKKYPFLSHPQLSFSSFSIGGNSVWRRVMCNFDKKNLENAMAYTFGLLKDSLKYVGKDCFCPKTGAFFAHIIFWAQN